MRSSSSTRLLVTLCLVGALTRGEVRQAWLNAKLKRPPHSFHKVLIVPVQVSLNAGGIKRGLPLLTQADELGEHLDSLLAFWLTKQGASVLPDSPRADSDSSERYALVQLQRAYDTLEVTMLRHAKDVRHGRFTLGEAVTVYPRAASADTLVFMRGSGTLYPRNVPGSAPWGAADQVFRGRLVFVDARTGEVLVFLDFSTFGSFWKGTASEIIPRIEECSARLPRPLGSILRNP